MKCTISVINGSLREGGNTDTLIDKYMEGLESEEITVYHFDLRNLSVSNCTGCYTCKNESKCHFQDDMTEIRNAIEQSEVLVFASPNYWCEITGLMKTFFDRLYFYHHDNTKNLIANKEAVIITTLGEDHNVEYECKILVEFYKRALKSLKISILDMLFFSGLMGKEDIRNKPEFLEQAYEAGKNLKGHLIK